MSRAKLIKRLDELEPLLRRSTASAERRFLEGLSDEDLDALYLELGGEPEPEPDCRPVRRVVTSRDVDVAVPDESLAASPEPEEIEQAPEPVSTAPRSEDAEETPSETQREPRVRRSNDLPESKAEERARLFELDTVRLAEPRDVPGSGFGRSVPPQLRRRRFRRF